MNTIIQDIRTHCRKAMNGIASTSMRNKGLAYKLNFGVPTPRIKEIASPYQPDKELAEELWLEDTRELKIIATLLYPIDVFTKDDAQRWAKQIVNQEIREQITLNLFQKLSFAESIAKQWIQTDDSDLRSTGYWLLSRLMIVKKNTISIQLTDAPYVWDDILSNNISLRNAAILFLKNVGKLSKELSVSILDKIATFDKSNDVIKQEIYDSLFFEFDYLYNEA